LQILHSYLFLLKDYGVPLFSIEIKSKHSKKNILTFINENIKPIKSVGNFIFIRRKYLKWIQWATPVPLQATVEVIENERDCVLLIHMKTLYFPWFAVLSPVLISLFENSMTIIESIFATGILAILIYLLALLEKAAILNKIRKISNLDTSYSIFA